MLTAVAGTVTGGLGGNLPTAQVRAPRTPAGSGRHRTDLVQSEGRPRSEHNRIDRRARHQPHDGRGTANEPPDVRSSTATGTTASWRPSGLSSAQGWPTALGALPRARAGWAGPASAAIFNLKAATPRHRPCTTDRSASPCATARRAREPGGFTASTPRRGTRPRYGFFLQMASRLDTPRSLRHVTPSSVSIPRWIAHYRRATELVRDAGGREHPWRPCRARPAA